MQSRWCATIAIAALFAQVPGADPQAGGSGLRRGQQPRLRGPLFSPSMLFGATDIEVADLDGDRRPEVISLKQTPSGVVISRLGQDLGFESAVFLNTTSFPSDVALADFDGDGDLDFAVANVGTPGFIDVFRNDGAGTFEVATSYSHPSSSSAVAAGDWDRDGDTDLANVQLDGLLGVYTNNGRGGFSGPRLVSIGFTSSTNTAFVLARDLDGDGRHDLVLGRGGAVAVVLAVGEGNFASAVIYPLSGSPRDGELADVDGDGVEDVVVTSNTTTISVLRGNGDGTFAAPLLSPSSFPLDAFDLMDLYGDGSLDLVGASVSAVIWFEGNGRGGFTERRRSIRFSSFGIRVADLDGDRRPELLIALPFVLALVPGDAAPGREFWLELRLGSSASAQQQAGLADMDGNGFDDTVIANSNGAGEVVVLFNDGRGGLDHALGTPLTGGAHGVETADVDGDGDQDAAAFSGLGDVVSVLTNDGFGRLDPPREFPAGADPVCLAFGDLDGDGDEDLALAIPSIPSTSLLWNDGAGDYSSASQILLGGEADPRWVETSDMDTDGDLDLVFVETAQEQVRWLANDGAGGFAIGGTGSVGAGPVHLAASDLELDGDLDLAVVDALGANVAVLRGDGKGALAPRELYETPSQPGHVAAGDVDGDGWPDLVTTKSGTGNGFALLRGDGTAFLRASVFALSAGPLAVHLADMDADGDLDVVAIQGSSQAVAAVSLNRARGVH